MPESAPLTSLSESTRIELVERLRMANEALRARYPGDGTRRQPVHVLYGGAHLFRADTTRKLGSLALKSLEQYAGDFVTFARALGIAEGSRLPDDAAGRDEVVAQAEADPVALRRRDPDAWLAATVYRRVVDKLRREPIESYGIDFEDGYGVRSDEEEDRQAVTTAMEVASALTAGALPPFLGIRIKPLTADLRDRGLRTLDIFLSMLVSLSRRRLPPEFSVTLPKISSIEQVEVLTDGLDRLEELLSLPRRAVKIELMVETTQAIVDETGRCPLPLLVTAARGRCVAAHFGPYDYAASCNVTAQWQQPTHPACAYARQVMQAALVGTGVRLADGPTMVMPTAPHVAEPGSALTETQREDNRRVVHAAWRQHYDHVRRGLIEGFYQGWDLHPAQLPARYAAVYAFFLEGLDTTGERLRNFLRRAAQATRIGVVFDDAATAQALLNSFLRGITSGAISEAEALAETGLALDELRTRSFARILKRRAKG